MTVRAIEPPMQADGRIALGDLAEEVRNRSPIAHDNEFIGVDTAKPRVSSNAAKNAIMFRGWRDWYMRPVIYQCYVAGLDKRFQDLAKIVNAPRFIKEDLPDTGGDVILDKLSKVRRLIANADAERHSLSLAPRLLSIFHLCCELISREGLHSALSKIDRSTDDGIESNLFTNSPVYGGHN